MPVGVDSSTLVRVIAAGVAAMGMSASRRALAGGGTGCVPWAIVMKPRPGRIGVAQYRAGPSFSMQ